MKEKYTWYEWMIITLIAVVVAGAILLGWNWLIWISYNFIARQFNWPSLSYWTVFVIVFLLGIIGSAFKSSSK